MHLGSTTKKKTFSIGHGIHASADSGGLVLITWSHGKNSSSDNLNFEPVFHTLAEFLHSKKAVILSEKYFGRLSSKDHILDIRARSFLTFKGSSPDQVTYIEGAPLDQGHLAGFHLIVLYKPDKVEAWTHSGISARGKDAEYLFLSDLGQLSEDEHRSDPSRDTQACFDSLAHVLHEKSWSFSDVFRTWFYLKDILGWYGDFNRVRNGVFAEMGLLDPAPSNLVPASTGISGESTRGWCNLDILAIKSLPGSSLEIERLENPLQNEAPSYGSAFSRALSVSTKHNKYLFISGTASIDENGKTVHQGDFKEQVARTYQNIKALLASGGARIDQISQSTFFIKNEADIPEFKTIIQSWDFPMQTAVCMIADICRDDLLFEIDATVILPRK